MAAAKQCHVMMFPWLAFGHMIPFHELSQKLAAKGIKVSFVSTPKNLARLPPISPSLATNFHQLEVVLPTIEGLPDNCEATIDLQLDEVQYLKKSHDMLGSQFEKLLQSDLPDLILMDCIPCWITEVAAKFGIPTAYFSVFTAASLTYLGPPDELMFGRQRTKPEDFAGVPDWIDFPSTVTYRPDFGPAVLSGLHFPDISGTSFGQRLAISVQSSQFVIIRSCREFEGEYIDLLEKLYRKPVLPIGLLPVPLAALRRREKVEVNSSWSTTFQWLDKQKPKSVLFVGFGSEYKMTIEEIHELALGIELSMLSFIWILRKPEGVEEADLLPPEFEKRNSDKGIVCLKWAPQIEILGHPAIGGCLFHSGWGSCIESLGFGHPLILLPMMADQGLNAKLFVEKGVGYEVPRGEDGSFTKEMVAESVRIVMETEQGEPIRSKASQMQDVFGNQEIHDNYISSFIQHLHNFKKNTSSVLE